MITSRPFGHYVLAPPALLAAIRFGEEPPAVTHGFLTEAFSVVARYRAELGQQESLFQDFYREVAAGGGSLSEIEALADEVHEAEERSRAGGATDLRKVTIGVKYYRGRHDRYARSMVRLGEEILDIWDARLELYQDLEIRLRKLASDRDPMPPSKTFSDAAEAAQYLRSLDAEG